MKRWLYKRGEEKQQNLAVILLLRVYMCVIEPYCMRAFYVYYYYGSI